MKEVVSIGKIEEVKIPSNLVYRGAVEQLVKDATGTGITIDLASFYSKEPIELHNFVDTITYRFVTEGKEESIEGSTGIFGMPGWCNIRELAKTPLKLISWEQLSNQRESIYEML